MLQVENDSLVKARIRKEMDIYVSVADVEDGSCSMSPSSTSQRMSRTKHGLAHSITTQNTSSIIDRSKEGSGIIGPQDTAHACVSCHMPLGQEVPSLELSELIHTKC